MQANLLSPYECCSLFVLGRSRRSAGSNLGQREARRER